MDSLNTIPVSGNFGDISSRLNDNFGKVSIEVETIKSNYIANKGYFDNLATLTTAHPLPKAGDIAYVYNSGYKIANVVDGEWVLTAISAPAVDVSLSDYAKKSRVDDVDIELSYDSEKYIPSFEKGSINGTSGVFGTTDLRIRAKITGFVTGDVVRVINNSIFLDTFGLFKYKEGVFVNSTGTGNTEITVDNTFDELWFSVKKADGFAFSDPEVANANANIDFVVKRGDTTLKGLVRVLDRKVIDVDYSDKLTLSNTAVNAPTGNNSSSSVVSATPLLYCGGYKKVKLSVIENTGVTTYGIAFYDSTKTYISGIARITGVANSFKIMLYDIPPTSEYFATCYWNTANTPVGGEFSCKLLSDVSTNVEYMGGGSSVFGGKKLHTFGSSNLTDEYGTWSQDMALSLNLTLTTSAVAGAKFAMASSAVTNSVVKQVEDYVAGVAVPDIILISSGMNDSWWSPATPLGDFAAVRASTLSAIRASYDSNFGINTLYGSLRYIIETLQSAYQDAFIVLCIPWQCWAERADGFEPYIQPMKDVARYYSVPVIDSFSEGGISRSFEPSGSAGRYTVDGIHIKTAGALNSKGRALQANFITDRMKKIYYPKK